MWRRLYNKKGQSTGEYALIFAIVLGAIVAMQTYVKKELQGRVKDAADYMTKNTLELGNTSQYDPYYFKSEYTTTAGTSATQDYADGQTSLTTTEDSTRGGYTEHSAAEEQEVE